MELFRGYVSLGGHGAAENLPRIDYLKQRLIEFYQPGMRNVYYEEAALRKAATLESTQQIHAAQPEGEKSIFVAIHQALGYNAESTQKGRDVLARYRLAVADVGPSQVRSMYQFDPQMEVSRIFSLAEYEMFDALPKNLNPEFTSDAYNSKDLTKLEAIIEKINRLRAMLIYSISTGNITSAVDIARVGAITRGEEDRFRNSRTLKAWNAYREDAIRDSRPTRLASRFGIGHASFADQLPADEWTFEYDFDPLLSPGYRLARACEPDPKKIPTDTEVLPVLLEEVVAARFARIDTTEKVRLTYLQTLLPKITVREVKQLIKRLPNGVIRIFDAFVQERGLPIPEYYVS